MCLVSPRFLGLTCTADVLSTCLAAPLPLQGFTFWGFCALGGGGGVGSPGQRGSTATAYGCHQVAKRDSLGPRCIPAWPQAGAQLRGEHALYEQQWDFPGRRGI